MTAPSLVKFRNVLLFLMLIVVAVGIVLMVDSYEYGPICLYMVRGPLTGSLAHWLTGSVTQ